MNKAAFEKIVRVHGKDILAFCRMTAGSSYEGDELYQDTMLALTEKINTLDENNNVKSYAIGVALRLWKNKKRKIARRLRIAPVCSFDELVEAGVAGFAGEPGEAGVAGFAGEPGEAGVAGFAGEPGEAGVAGFAGEPGEAMVRAEELQRVRKAVSDLPERYRIPLYMQYSADMTINEIAAALRLPESTVKTRIRRAKDKLKKMLEVEEHE